MSTDKTPNGTAGAHDQAAVNPAWSMRRQIPYLEWLQLRDERNALSIQADRQADYIRQLETIICKQKNDIDEIHLLCKELVKQKGQGFTDEEVRAEIDRLTGK